MTDAHAIALANGLPKMEKLEHLDLSDNKIRLANIAKRSVTETSPPSATVPPKLEIINIAKPKKSTIEVYDILTPASLIEE